MILTTLALTVAVGALFAGPATAGCPSLKQLRKELRRAVRLRDRARERARNAAADLAVARELLAATAVVGEAGAPDGDAAQSVLPSTGRDLVAELLADGIVTTDEVAALKARSTAAARLARRAAAKVTSLRRRIARRQRIAEWNRRGRWRPLIAIAAAKYGVSARGLHRMMMLESGGRRTAGTLYKGLFQYHPSTWRASWNPWRRQSIFDGWAQIRATAYAIRRGMGPSQWPNTYRMAF